MVTYYKNKYKLYHEPIAILHMLRKRHRDTAACAGLA